jgi:hypothetical protein
MEHSRSRLPSPAMIVAIIGLVVGLTGSAVALQGKNSVKSNDIAPDAVKGKDIASDAVKGKDIASDAVKGRQVADSAITSPKLDLFETGAAAEEVSTTSPPPVDLGGPSATVTVPANGLVGIFARVEGRATGGGPAAVGQVHLFEPTFLSSAPPVMQYPSGADFRVRQTTPGQGDSDGVGAALRGGMIVLAPPAGTYTFSLRYSQQGGATALFRNRALWAGVLN